MKRVFIVETDGHEKRNTKLSKLQDFCHACNAMRTYDFRGQCGQFGCIDGCCILGFQVSLLLSFAHFSIFEHSKFLRNAISFLQRNPDRSRVLWYIMVRCLMLLDISTYVWVAAREGTCLLLSGLMMRENARQDAYES